MTEIDRLYKLIEDDTANRFLRLALIDELNRDGNRPDALRQQICMDPDNVQLRLDWAEAAKDTEPEQSRLTLMQYELAATAPRVKVTEEHLFQPHGPRYWSTITQHELEVGDRVDFLNAKIVRKSLRMKPFKAQGLRVSRIFRELEASGHQADIRDVVVVQDEYSVPDRREQLVEEVRFSCQTLDTKFRLENMLLLPHRSRSYRTMGFVGWLPTSIGLWSSMAGKILAREPVVSVEIVSSREALRLWLPANPKWTTVVKTRSGWIAQLRTRWPTVHTWTFSETNPSDYDLEV